MIDGHEALEFHINFRKTLFSYENTSNIADQPV